MQDDEIPRAEATPDEGEPGGFDGQLDDDWERIRARMQSSQREGLREDVAEDDDNDDQLYSSRCTCPLLRPSYPAHPIWTGPCRVALPRKRSYIHHSLPRPTLLTDDSSSLVCSRRRADSEDEESVFSHRCCMWFAAVAVALLACAGYQLYLWFNPAPLSVSIDIVRPQKFRIDVTDFFTPRISAALQLVLQA